MFSVEMRRRRIAPRDPIFRVEDEKSTKEEAYGTNTFSPSSIYETVS